jgi:hypothetical protein
MVILLFYGFDAPTPYRYSGKVDFFNAVSTKR